MNERLAELLGYETRISSDGECCILCEHWVNFSPATVWEHWALVEKFLWKERRIVTLNSVQDSSGWFTCKIESSTITVRVKA